VDYKAYIESGKLESYVLGYCTAEEMQEVECMARIFPEVKQELEAIRISMEQIALQNKVEPPASLKDKIFAAIEDEVKSVENTKGKIITMQEPVVQKGSSWRQLAAACIALLLVSSFVLYNFYSTNNNLKEEVAELKGANKEMIENNKQLSDEIATASKQMQIFNNPSITKVAMKGQAVSPNSLATIYWDKNSREVYLSVNALPAPPQGKQYQLWGIVNGAPVDLGVFDITDADTIKLQTMKQVDNAAAFAVTLEKVGGSPTPTLTEMYVMGAL